MKAFDRDLVSGSVVRSVWKLAWPAVLLRLVDGLHSIVDHILVGNFVGHHGNAAVGAAWLLFLVVVLFLASLFQGMVVLVSRYSGMQDRANLSWVVYQTFLATIYLFALVIAPVGFFVAPHALALVNITPEVNAHALPYLRIMFTCAAPLFLSLMLAMAFQASGDPKTPLILGALTTSVNIVLSITLITGLGPFPEMGTAGAALATSTAPSFSVGIGLFLIYRRKMIVQPPPRYTLKPDFHLLKNTARIGMPTGIQAVLLNFGGVLLFRKLGVLPHSAAAQAAFTICYTQIFSLVTWAGFGLRIAAATLMGQNLGAGNALRGKRAVYVAAGLGVAWAAALGLVFWFVPGPLLALFDAVDEPVYSYGVELLRFAAFAGVFLVSTLTLTGGLQGAGETRIPMYIAFIAQIVIMLGWVEIWHRLDMLTPNLAWAALLVSQFSRWVMTQVVFTWGRWIKSLKDLRSSPSEATEGELDGGITQ